MAIEEGWDGGGGGGRSSWLSERKDGGQVSIEQDGDDFEVESAMLAPLAELHDRKLEGGLGKRVRAATKRRRAIFASLAGFVVMMIIYASAGGAASAKWADANNVCEHLKFESTAGSSVHEVRVCVCLRVYLCGIWLC